MRVALLGDVHARFDLVERALQRAVSKHRADCAIQLGDFGFFEDLLGAGRQLLRFPVPLLVLCGNHEDHPFLARARHNGLALHWAENGLVYQPRASLARLDNCLVGFLGGAMHIDRPQEAHNRPGPQEVLRAIECFNAHQPEALFTHSCPPAIGIGMRGNDALIAEMQQYVLRVGIDPGPPGDRGEPALGELWQALRHKPRLWVFGHFHQHRDVLVGGTRFISTPPLDEGLPLLLWDTRTYEVWLA